MPGYLEGLVKWASEWSRSGPWMPVVTLRPSDASLAKRSAWLVIEGSEIAGQITVWDTGECDLEAYSIATGVPILLDSRRALTSHDVMGAIMEVVEVCR